MDINRIISLEWTETQYKYLEEILDALDIQIAVDFPTGTWRWSHISDIISRRHGPAFTAQACFEKVVQHWQQLHRAYDPTRDGINARIPPRNVIHPKWRVASYGQVLTRSASWYLHETAFVMMKMEKQHNSLENRELVIEAMEETAEQENWWSGDAWEFHVPRTEGAIYAQIEKFLEDPSPKAVWEQVLYEAGQVLSGDRRYSMSWATS